MDGDVDQRPDTPASCASESSLPSDVLTLLSSTDPEHRGVDVHHLERWRDRIEVRHVSYLAVTSARSSQTGDHHHRRSVLKELDLSYNDFDEVPAGLSCVAPCLERLNLSHNQLTRFGPLDCYPTSLRLLDLSHNRISAMVDLCSEDCRGSASSTSTPIPTPSLLSSSSQRCFSPFSLKRSVTTSLVWIFKLPCLRCRHLSRKSGKVGI